MLRSFRVANHKSIRDEAELLLMPAYDKSRPVVPVAGIFGANASGKSNLIDALSFMTTAVRTSYGRWEAGTGVPRSPHRLSAACLAEPSRFEVDLVIDDIQYAYGFVADDEAILEEWLYSYPHRRKSVIFERNGNHIDLGSTLSERRSRTELLTGLTRDNSLLLAAAVQAKQEEVVPVYDWFRRGLRFTRSRSVRNVPVRVAERVEMAMSRHDAFIELLRVADLGIVDIRIDTVEISPPRYLDTENQRATEELDALRVRMSNASDSDRKQLTERIERLNRLIERNRLPAVRKELVFLHGRNSVPLALSEQSDGTIAWLELIALGLDALAAGNVAVVDEIDASLHPRLTARLIELFQSEQSNRQHAQLLFTTHDANLLGTSFGNEILGRDEVWFVEKDKDGATTLFPLTDFHPRKHENTERRYLGGSYGAVPAVFSNTLVDRLSELASESHDVSP